MQKIVPSLLLSALIWMPGQLLSAQAKADPGFRTPSDNIACTVFNGFLRCDLSRNQAKLPPKPKDCDLDWGNAFEMSTRGSSMRQCVGDTVYAKQPILAYGKTWKYGGFTCISRSNGLTCRNQAGHGWFINLQQQKLF